MNTDEDKVIYEGPIAGVSYGHYKFRPDRLKNAELVVVPKPDNEYDPRAIALVKINGTMAHHVGYIPRKQTWRCHEVLEAGGKLDARVTRIDLSKPAYDMATVTITTRPTTHQLRRRAAKLKPLNPIGTRRILL